MGLQPETHQSMSPFAQQSQHIKHINTSLKQNRHCSSHSLPPTPRAPGLLRHCSARARRSFQEIQFHGDPVPLSEAAAQQVPQEADFDLYSPVTRDWHQIRATNIGSRGTQFFIDGSLVGGEDYQLSLLALVGSCWNFVGAGVVRCGFSAWTEKVRTTTT